jgi:hypothetical protein
MHTSLQLSEVRMDQFAALAEKDGGKAPEHFVWSFPGSIMVELSLDVVSRLEPQLKDTPQGLLLGDTAGAVPRIRDFRAVTPAELAGLRRSVPVPSELTNGAAVMGYFRVQREGDLRLTPEDLNLAAALIPHPNQVFLLIEYSGSGTANASFFFWDSGRMFGDFAFLEFPFEASLLAAQERARRRKTAAERAAELLQAPDVPREPEISQPAAPRKGRKRKKAAWSVAVLLFASTAGGAYYVERFTPGGLWRARQWKSLTFNGKHTPATPTVSASLGLQVERQPRGDIRLTWDRTAPPVAEATGGSFIIQDGTAARVIPLDAGLVHAGSLLYTPSTDQVQMRLTVDREGQSPVTEMVLVVVPTSGAPQLHALAPQNAAPSLTQGLNLGNPPPEPRVQRELKSFVVPATETVAAPPPVLALPPVVDPNQKLAAEPPVMANGSLFGVPQPVAPRPATVEPAAQPLTDYVPPEVIKQNAPIVPAGFRGPLNQAEQVKVTVTVDEVGKVVKVTPTASGRTQALVPAAVVAAYGFRFKPARLRGQAVRSDVRLTFNFQPRQ